MLSKDKLTSSKDIWFGLNNNKMSIDESDMVIFGVPFDTNVRYRSGAAESPKILRESTKMPTPYNENFESFHNLRVLDVGDFIYDKKRSEYFQEISDFVSDLIKKEKFFCMIGGDHSTTIPVLKGIDQALDEEFGIIHIDAHFDLCDTVDGDKYSHGSTQRRSLDLKNISSTENIYFIAQRSIEKEEYLFKKENKLNIISSAMFHRLESDRISEEVSHYMKNFKRVYITIDIDCLDPAFAAGTGTPQFGGLYSRQLITFLKRLSKKLNVVGVDIVEMAPNLDYSLTSIFAGRKLMQEFFGLQAEKLGKLEK